MNRSLKIDAATLADEARWMAKLRVGHAFNPVVQVVQVSTVLGALQLRRTDFEQFREAVIPAEGAGQATVTVNAAQLAALLKGASGPAIVDIGDFGLSIELPERIMRLRSTDDELPAWPSFEPTGQPAVLGAGQLARALTSVGTDEALPALTGVAFDDGAMVTTDRFRLTRIIYADSGFTALISGEVLRAFADGTDVVTVEAAETMVRLSSGGRSILAGMLGHEFPKWRKLIPADEESPVSTVLRRADLLAAAQGEHVTLTVDDSTIRVCSTTRDGDVEIEQEIEQSVIRGDKLPFTVKLATKLLAGCLRGISSGAVQFEASAPDKPVMLRDALTLHLIMPIKP